MRRRYVLAYAAAFYGSPPGAPVAPTANVATRRILLGCGALTVLGIIAAIWFGNILVSTRAFGLFSCVREPYYGQLTGRIASEPAFRRELGDPIVVDAPKVYCSNISDENDRKTASCELPVRGPRGTGTVHAEIVDQDDELSTKLDLRVGDRVVRPTS